MIDQDQSIQPGKSIVDDHDDPPVILDFLIVDVIRERKQICSFATKRQVLVGRSFKLDWKKRQTRSGNGTG